MKVIALNGSARKNGNTHTLLLNALEGAQSVGAQTELINLYDLEFKGCTGCLGCKVKGSINRGHCVVHDDLKPVLDKIDKSNGLILGSPIYLGDITAVLRGFWERFIFQYLSYDRLNESLFRGNLKAGFIYTMNVTAEYIQEGPYQNLFKTYENTLRRYFHYAGTVVATETLQVDDYSKYHMALFNEAERKERKQRVFSDDCLKAYELGRAIGKV